MDDWSIFQNQATKSFISNTIWKSFIQERLYKIISVEEVRIVVERVSGGKPAHFTRGEALRAIQQLREHGRVRKGELIHTVVRETMLVHLHPSVYWDSQSHEIYWNENTSPSFEVTQNFIEDASDDDLEKIQIEVNKRKSRSKFRENLLSTYNNQCAISNVGPNVVLQAAHIVNHSKSGINSNDNGILLRSDLHNLFDAGYLLIHPLSLTVHLHPSLKDSYYWKFEGVKLATRKDLSNLNENFLKEKWNESEWAVPLA